MSKVISTINLKGGVGKTSMTIALAEFLAIEHFKKVLIIDLDPQTNATVALMDQEKWDEKDKNGETLYQMFKDKIDKTSHFDIRKAIVKNVSNINDGVEGLDLLPSSLRLIDLQDELPSIPARNFHAITTNEILKGAISKVKDDYDYILIDCPPNLGLITLNGIQISDHYIIPCIPDILSTHGIPQILDRINGFKALTGSTITPLGIVISMYRKQSRLHDATIRKLKGEYIMGKYPRVFDTIIPMNTRTAGAVEYDVPFTSLMNKYGYNAAYDCYSELTKEFMTYAGN